MEPSHPSGLKVVTHRLLTASRLAVAVPAICVGLSACDRPASPGNVVRPPAKSGELVWSYPATSIGRVALDDSLVFFAGAHHELIALDKATGALTWRVHTTYTSGITQGFGATVAGSVIILADYWLWAYDRRTGARKWIYDLGTPMAPGYSLPATDGTRVFAAGIDGQVAALDASTGTEIWRRPSPMTYPAQANAPTVDGDDLYVCYNAQYPGLQGGLASFNANTGAVQWIHDYTTYVIDDQSAFCTTATVVADTALYSSFHRGDVVALHRTTGELLWRKPSALAEVFGRRHSALVRDVLVVGSRPGDLEGLNPSNGNQLWRVYFAPATIFWPLAADATTVYPTYSGGHLAAVDAATGMVKWTRGFNSASYLGVEGTPAVDDSTVYAGGDDGLFAIRK